MLLSREAPSRPEAQQFQIWVAAANSVSAARPMVDALRLSTLETGSVVGWIRRAARCQGLGTAVAGAASTRGRAVPPKFGIAAGGRSHGSPGDFHGNICALRG